MRTLMLLVKTTLLGLSLLFTLELIRFLFVGHWDVSSSSLISPTLIFILMFPVNAMLHDRPVERVYMKDITTLEQLERMLSKGKAKCIRNSENLRAYKLSALYTWNREVIITDDEQAFRINAPIRMIRFIDKHISQEDTME